MKDRLAKAMEARSVTPRDIYSRKILSKAGIYFLLDGTTTAEKVRDSTVASLCGFLKINRAWLLTGKGPRDAGTTEPDPDTADILAYKQAASMGEGAVPDEYAETHAPRFLSAPHFHSARTLGPRHRNYFHFWGLELLTCRSRSLDLAPRSTTDAEPA